MRARFVAILLGSLLLVPSTAAAAGRQAVYDDCSADDTINQTFTPSALRDALAHIPADVDQYTECRAAIGAALRGEGLAGSGDIGGTNTGGSWGGSAIPGVPTGVDPLATATAPEKAAIARAAEAGAAPVILDGTPINPAALGSSGLHDPTDLPSPLLAVVVLLALFSLAAATRWSMTYVNKRRAAR